MLQEIETETDDDVDVLQELYGLARSWECCLKTNSVSLFSPAIELLTILSHMWEKICIIWVIVHRDKKKRVE